MRHWKTILATGAVLAVLTGCSDGEAKVEPTGGTSTGGGSTATSAEPGGNAWCDEGEATDDVEVTFGDMAAASDEWAESIDREWRHYFPVTVTNSSDKPCVYSLQIDATVEGGDTANEDFSVALEPGQTYHGQVFDLEELVEFSGDAQDATPTAPVTPAVYRVGRSPLLVDYYDAQLEIEGVEGKGGDAMLKGSVTMVGTKDGVPARLASAKEDNLIVHGLDAQGDIVLTGRTTIDPVPDGETVEIEMPIGGGDSSEWVRKQEPLSAFDSVVTWEIGLFQPVFTEASSFDL